MEEEKKPDPHDVLKRAEKILGDKTLEDKLQTYHIELVCQEKTEREIKERSESKFYEIPGKYPSHQKAEEIYTKHYEEYIIKECKGKFSEVYSIKILSEEEWKNRITELTLSRESYTRIPRKPEP
jgi:uncharacterized membrane protein YhiD involved in acid resistance